MEELDFSNIVPDWRGNVHKKEFPWSPEMENLYPRDELLEEGSIADWGMLVDAVKQLQAEGKPLTEENIVEGINAQVLKVVEDTCAKFERMGLGYNTEDGRFVFYEEPTIVNDDIKHFPGDYPG